MNIMMNENNDTLLAPSSQDLQTLPNIVSDDNDSRAPAQTDIAQRVQKHGYEQPESS